MVKFILNKTFASLKNKPTKLWGVFLLNLLLMWLACLLGFIPVLYLPICCLLQVGMTAIYLNFYRTGQQPECDDLFAFFKNDFKSVLKIAGGILWMELWIFLWLLIPIVGPVFAIIKAYSYRFTPYILAEDKEIKATDALKKSMALTQGYKGKMFLCDLAIYGAYFGAVLLLSLLARIPYIGILFALVLIVLNIAYFLFIALIYGVESAAFYEEISTMTPEKYSAIVNPQPMYQPQQQNYAPMAGGYAPQNAKHCPNCGESLPEGAKFCNKCGTPLN